ncbi:MAG TPA: lysophospholipid acyltransferase family protein [Chitinophagales bacterium]|nr:lysophospholipid acyltransferase family protein [Chitinophagales bacterium]
MKLLARFIFWLTGWRTAGQVPQLKKFVAILAPHTSGWDVFYGFLAKYIFGIHFAFYGKKEIFDAPYGFIFKALGGIPVDRSKHSNLVEQAVATFNERDEFILALSPEGTRKYVEKWKTGFYYIALQAKVPIVLTYLDFEHKVAGIGPTFYPTGDIDKDIEEIKNFYRPIKGRHPEKGIR